MEMENGKWHRGAKPLRHYKQIVLEKIQEDRDPNDRHIREWTDKHISPKRLLNCMQREGLIDIEWVNDRGCIRRVLTARQSAQRIGWTHQEN